MFVLQIIELCYRLLQSNTETRACLDENNFDVANCMSKIKSILYAYFDNINKEQALSLNIETSLLISLRRKNFTEKDIKLVSREILNKFYSAMYHDYILFQYQKPNNKS